MWCAPFSSTFWQFRWGALHQVCNLFTAAACSAGQVVHADVLDDDVCFGNNQVVVMAAL